MATSGLSNLGEDALKNVHQSVYNSLITYDDTVRSKLNSDIEILANKINSRGKIVLDTNSAINTTIVNQITKQGIREDVARMQIGGSYISGNNDIVDETLAETGSSATIFQLVNGKLLRISTTVKKQDGSRGIGTYIPSDSPVYKTIMSGETFKGKAYVINEWYLTQYSPLHDASGEIVGAIYVGQQMINSSVKNFILSTKIGQGYFYLYDEKGRIVLHPTLPLNTDLFEMVPELNDHKDGMLHYQFKGSERISNVKYIENWGVFVNASLSREDIIQGLDKEIMRNNFIVGLLVIAGAIVITLLLVRTINSPLKELANKSIKVGEGDYTIRFEAESDDAIGQLAVSMDMMVAKSKEMIEDIIESSQALSSASTKIAEVSDEMVENADSTTNIADQTTVHADDVSNNMNSVSAAMEQSTSNLEMIAAASEEMGTTIKEIAENSSRARLTTEEAVLKAQKSHEGVTELGTAASSIGTVTEAITEISEQTNLLALNATIEAARAGEAGKGFAVVANEIKDLAKETANATSQIKQAIEGIQNQTKITVMDIESITTVIKDVNDVVNTIVTAVEEQSITTNEIVSNVGQASQGINVINQNVSESNQMTSMVSDGVGQVKEKSQEVKSNSEYLRNSANSLSQLSEKLASLVAKFQI